MSAGLEAYLASRSDRCPYCHHHAPTQGHGRGCAPTAPDGVDEAWPTFVAAIRQAVRDDGTVHASDLRVLLRDRIPPKTRAACYRRARSQHLLVEIGHERSDDELGRNAGRMEPYYRLAA